MFVGLCAGYNISHVFFTFVALCLENWSVSLVSLSRLCLAVCGSVRLPPWLTRKEQLAHRNEFSTETGINFAVSLRFMGNNEMREKGEKVDYSKKSTFSYSWACALDTVFPMYFFTFVALCFENWSVVIDCYTNPATWIILSCFSVRSHLGSWL